MSHGFGVPQACRELQSLVFARVTTLRQGDEDLLLDQGDTEADVSHFYGFARRTDGRALGHERVR